MNFKNLMAVYSDGPDDGGSGNAGNTPAPEPTAPTQGVPAPVNTPAVPAAPWADTLAQAFPDEAVRGQVDQYLREQVQPYVTRREQELGQVRQVWDNLWDEDNSIPTFLELANAAYGEDLTRELAGAFKNYFEGQGLSPEDAAQAAVQTTGELAQAQTQQQVPDMEAYLATLPPEYRAVVEAQISDQEDREYNALLDDISTRVEPTIKGREELFSKYVGTMDDINQAVQQWQQEMAPYLREHPDAFLPGSQETQEAVQRADQQIAQQQAATTTAAQPAPVLGQTGAQGSTVPPQQPQHQSMEDAIHDFMVDIGTVSDGRL